MSDLDYDALRKVAEAATNGGFGWRLGDVAGANEVWANRDAVGHDAFMVATTATRLNPNPGATGHADADHIASFDPPAVLRLLDLAQRAEADRVAVERVRALADQWEQDYPTSLAAANRECDEWWIDLRAALDPKADQ